MVFWRSCVLTTCHSIVKVTYYWLSNYILKSDFFLSSQLFRRGCMKCRDIDQQTAGLLNSCRRHSNWNLFTSLTNYLFSPYLLWLPRNQKFILLIVLFQLSGQHFTLSRISVLHIRRIVFFYISQTSVGTIQKRNGVMSLFSFFSTIN